MYILAGDLWFQKLMRTFFFSIDKIVFNFIPTLYDLLMSIAKTSILSQADILDMADRIYKLLAVFMVFKVTFSLIMYVVNPDDFSDKSKGVSKLGINIVFSLAMLILVPDIFKGAYELQTYILKDNSLGTLVFGEDSQNAAKNPMNTSGSTMAFMSLSPFFVPNLSLTNENFDIVECSTLTTNNDGVIEFNNECYNALSGLTEDNEYFSQTTLENYKVGVSSGSLGMMFRLDMATARTSNGDDFIMDYRYIFSTVVGIVIVLLLVTFCLDVALRSIKLAVLQLIAPIPILSYVDPKSGKDGLFKKWYQMCFKTYLSLFIRLLAIYFATYIISRVDKMVDIIDGSYQTNAIIKIFVIIGALMFAKQLPKMLEGLGIKLDGGFQLNPLRKIEKEALGGGILKKPNDMLGRMGKGIVTAPFSGASLLGKKTIGGIDALRSGKSFKQGWDRTHGKLYNNFYKKLDEWAPDSAEARKNERQGREKFTQMNKQWTKGKEFADNLMEYAKRNKISVSKPFDLLDGKDQDAYRTVYKNDEFIKSRMALDAKDAERKILQNISDSTMRGTSIRDAIEAQKDKIDNIGGNFKLDMEKILAIGAEKNADGTLVKDADGNYVYKNADAQKTAFSAMTSKVGEKLENTTKAVSGMEKVHETIRAQDPTDAEIEDSLKFVKYNTIDPTDPTNPSREARWESIKVEESSSSGLDNIQQTTVNDKVELTEADYDRMDIEREIKELEEAIKALNREKEYYSDRNHRDDGHAMYAARRIEELEQRIEQLKKRL